MCEVVDKVTRQCPQASPFQENGEPKRNRTEDLCSPAKRLTARPSRLTHATTGRVTDFSPWAPHSHISRKERAEREFGKKKKGGRGAERERERVWEEEERGAERERERGGANKQTKTTKSWRHSWQ